MVQPSLSQTKGTLFYSSCAMVFLHSFIKKAAYTDEEYELQSLATLHS
jgi:hypothetical protein